MTLTWHDVTAPLLAPAGAEQPLCERPVDAQRHDERELVGGRR